MGYIYTITSLKKHDIGHGLNRLVYVGSCIDYMERFRQHKSRCFNEKSNDYNHKVYTMIREYGLDNFVFEVIEVMSDDTTDEELRKMEQKYIDKFESKKSMNSHDAVLNKKRVKKYKREWFLDNEERIRKHYAEYRSKNRQMINELQRNKHLLKVTFRAFCNITIYE